MHYNAFAANNVIRQKNGRVSIDLGGRLFINVYSSVFNDNSATALAATAATTLRRWPPIAAEPSAIYVTPSSCVGYTSSPQTIPSLPGGDGSVHRA